MATGGAATQRRRADKGYIGAGIHTPTRKPTHRDLTETEKTANTVIHRLRWIVERGVAHLKNWKILAHDYRPTTRHFHRHHQRSHRTALSPTEGLNRPRYLLLGLDADIPTITPIRNSVTPIISAEREFGPKNKPIETPNPMRIEARYCVRDTRPLPLTLQSAQRAIGSSLRKISPAHLSGIVLHPAAYVRG